jgi:two-component system CheB/CheR fusion protein
VDLILPEGLFLVAAEIVADAVPQDAFLGRANALSAAYTLLSRESWTEIPLRDVLLEEVRPFVAAASNNVSLAGAPILLKPRGALALGMVVHELVTNAVKYGALSVPDGKVAIEWDVESRDGTEQLVWKWSELDGPPIAPPDRKGFGLSMIERSLRHELKGEAIIAFEPEGVRATIAIPLEPGIATRAVPEAAKA